jgi:1-hydroxycarotenoid 3,4-desaturase
MTGDKVVIVGAGVGGLVSAALLAARGLDVTVCEAQSTPGGKLRAVDGVDAGPTVFTMRDVFDEVFDACGSRLDDHLTVTRADILARHAWPDGGRLDLFADSARSEDAVGDFAGDEAVRGFRKFRAEAKRLHDALDRPFLRDSKTDPLTLGWRMGLRGLPDWLTLRAYTSMWAALGRYFPDPRLRQLFARYTTYCGSSPFETPATLMLIAHVEASGVWLIEGGMHKLAGALTALGERAGVRFRYGTPVAEVLIESGRASGIVTAAGEHIRADCVIVNADPATLGAGSFGPAATRAVGKVPRAARSLSALVWIARGRVAGMDFDRHNVLFSSDYRAEFDALKVGRVPDRPSVYLHAQTQDSFQIIVNAPPDGDTHHYTPQEIDRCQSQMLHTLSRCGAKLDITSRSVLTPTDFEQLNRSTGGALYGRASHGWAASFRRQSSRTRIPGL